jgi:hypothetical protein
MVAMYAALITDIRRAWHAIRIYEHSPLPTDALIPIMVGSQPGSYANSEDERASFIAISTQDRLRLYTRGQIEELLQKADWTKSLLEVFSSRNVTQTIDTCLNKVSTSDIPQALASWETQLLTNLKEMDSLYSAEYADTAGDTQKPRPVFEDEGDLRNWRGKLRALGWIACEEWPGFAEATTDDQETSKLLKSLQAFEEKLFPRPPDGQSCQTYRLSIFQDDQINGEHARTAARAAARAARSFVWLLYGLAPSLPAVIHTHTMGFIYHADLSFRDRMSGSGGDEALLQEILENVTALYNTAQTEIDKWAELVGRLSALFRYVWEKYLHLHIGLTLESMLGTEGEADASASAFLQRYGYQTPPDGAKSVFQRMQALFVGKQKLATHLAIMPDVASSTLFGEHWLAYILDRLVLMGKIELERPESYSRPSGYAPDAGLDETYPFSKARGVFAETELWLWATNRFLRKLRREVFLVADRLGQKREQAPPGQRSTARRRRRP